jgi:hypothetical protein
MNKLLAEVIDAHGGMDHWNAYQAVTASIVSGGGFFALKGLIQDPDPRRMTVWLHEQRSSVLPYGAPDQRTVFTPDRIAIEKASRILQRRGAVDLPDDAVPAGGGGRTHRGDRALGPGR